MPIFGKSKEKHDFYLLVHSLAPFPPNIKSLYIAWKRGATKEGRTKSVAPTIEGPGRSWAAFHFEESFHVDCALSQVPHCGRISSHESIARLPGLPFLAYEAPQPNSTPSSPLVRDCCTRASRFYQKLSTDWRAQSFAGPQDRPV